MYGIKNEKILTSEEVLAILHRSATSDIPNMLIRHCYCSCFGKRKRKVIIFMRFRFGKHNFMHLAGMKSEIVQCWSNFMKHV